MTQTIIYNDKHLTVHYAMYHNGNTALTLRDADGMPYAHVTCNIGIHLDADECFIGDNAREQFVPMDELIASGILTSTEYRVRPGGSFVTYTKYKINREVVT